MPPKAKITAEVCSGRNLFEIFGNRGIYHDGWFAGTIHRAPWEAKPRRPLLEDVWELYDTKSDFSLVNDLAAKEPAQLSELMLGLIGGLEKQNALYPVDKAGQAQKPKLPPLP